MFQFLSFKKAFLLSFSLFLSFSIFSFNPLETLLWPDPDFKTKLSFSKFSHFKKPAGAGEFEGSLEGTLESSMVPGLHEVLRSLQKLLKIKQNFDNL